ncbi:MAG: hypothetical protein EOP24_37260 [Hyphomicrobiales bacterium]|nr:MAG: hypothetical protein EOP24_37260 [Hyphomicrobiales bacterium]
MSRRILLDTNLWSYLGDEDGGPGLTTALRDRGCEIVLAPSVLLEVLRSPHAESRRRIVETMIASKGKRLASEAELCAAQFVAVVKKLRPEWIRAMADTAKVDTYHKYWTKRVWRVASRDPDHLHKQIAGLDSTESHLLTVQRQNRESVLNEKFNFEIDDLWAEPSIDWQKHDSESYMEGWDGSRVPAWRIELCDYYWQFMTTRGSIGQTERDWVGAYVDLRRATSDRANFTKMWIDEIDAAEVPRDWIRWAVRWVQSTMKITDGNPRDEQHSAYLVDADLCLSADRRFVGALQAIRRRAPVEFADLRLVKVDRSVSIVENIVAALDR